jgi:hypothetical protein
MSARREPDLEACLRQDAALGEPRAQQRRQLLFRRLLHGSALLRLCHWRSGCGCSAIAAGISRRSGWHRRSADGGLRKVGGLAQALLLCGRCGSSCCCLRCSPCSQADTGFGTPMHVSESAARRGLQDQPLTIRSCWVAVLLRLPSYAACLIAWHSRLLGRLKARHRWLGCRRRTKGSLLHARRARRQPAALLQLAGEAAGHLLRRLADRRAGAWQPRRPRRPRRLANRRAGAGQPRRARRARRPAGCARRPRRPLQSCMQTCPDKRLHNLHGE